MPIPFERIWGQRETSAGVRCFVAQLRSCGVKERETGSIERNSPIQATVCHTFGGELIGKQLARIFPGAGALGC